MIFDCPRCQAENTIPAVQIPQDGKVVTCEGCNQPFRVLPPDPDDLAEDETANLELPERTAVGMTPMVQGPMEEEHTEAPEPPEGVLTPLMNVAIVEREQTDAGSLADDATGFDARFHGGAGDVATARIQGSANAGQLKTAPFINMASTALAPAPEAAGPSSGAAPLAEPLASARSPAAIDLIELFQRVPLALKVGVAVFPIALVAILLIGNVGARDSDTPIELPVANQAPREAPVPEGDAAEPSEPVDPNPAAVVAQPSKDPVPFPSGAGLAKDVPMKEPYAYIEPEEVKLKTIAGEGGDTVARLKGGAVVKRFEQVGDSVLVMVGDKGPVGFVRGTALSEYMPIGILAERHSFSSCDGDTAAQCSSAAKTEHQGCISGCETSAPIEGMDLAGIPELRARCKRACDLALAHCERACEHGKHSSAPVSAKPKPKRSSRGRQPLTY
jgi:predicted Zn finger-like uncharacterized protein